MVRITVLSLLSIVAGLAIVAGAFLWRLSQGPVSLDFLAPRVQEAINRNLTDMSVRLAGLVIERRPDSGAPSFHLRNVELLDKRGGLIARAPRAAVRVDESALFSGSIVPTGFELIGPRIMIKRTLEGVMELGFGAPAADEGEMIDLAPSPTELWQGGKADRSAGRQAIMPETSGSSLLEALSGSAGHMGGSGIGSLEDIRISNASITLFDEANDSYWSAPQTELAFKRMPFGFTVAASAAIASGGEPWRTELTLTYRRESRSFAIGARIMDLVPANISDEIFALSQLAQVQLPLSGHAELEIGEDGKLAKGSAEFSAAAGRVGLPDFISEPIIVDEGALRVDYDPATGGVAIGDSSILVGGNRAELTGRIDPVREPDGLLKALDIKLNARNVNLDTAGTVKDPLAIDRIDFDGTAGVEDARLDIHDLIVLAGKAGVRVRGAITDGEKSPGILLAGRIQELPAAVLKKLWPPMVSPNTRRWVSQNILEGKITSGEFTVTLPPDQLAAAQAAKLLPDPAIDAKFSMTGVTTTYFEALPPIRNASGNAHLRGDSFKIDMNAARIDLPSGKSISIARGSMVATKLLAVITPSEFSFEASAPAQAALEYMDLEPLNLLDKAGLDPGKLGGSAKVTLGLSIPLMKDVPKDMVEVRAEAKITDASLKGAIPGIDIADGAVDVTVGSGLIEAKGPVKLNGIPAKLTWSRGTAKDAGQTAMIEAELDGEERKKIGADIGEYLGGPTKVKVTIPEFRDRIAKVSVEADLSKAELRLEPIGWSYPPTPKTSARFDYVPSDGKGGRIENLEVAGDGVTIKGDIGLAPKGGLASADLPAVVLSEENRFGVTLDRGDGGTMVSIRGVSFDARPLIKTMFAPNKPGGGSDDAQSQDQLRIDANVEWVYAHRGEIISGVRGTLLTRGGTVQQADVQGSLLSGQPISLRITPASDGRRLQVGGRDGGAALRAANLYSKIAGGQIEFTALLAGGGLVRNGELVLRDFEVRNEAALAELDRKGKPRRSAQQSDGIAFDKLTLPFTADARFVRIGQAVVRGTSLCASAQGLIRKTDGAIEVDGSIVPACGINNLPGQIPILGDILVPDGLFGLNYTLGGTLNKPDFDVNPVSVLLPGFLRDVFFGGAGSSEPGKTRPKTN